MSANPSGGISSLPENVPPACTSRELEVEPLFVVLSLVRGLQPNRRKDDVDGPMAHNEPLVLGLDNMTNPQQLDLMQPWGSSPGPHNGVTPEVGLGTLAWLKAPSGGEIRRWSVGTL